MLERCIPSCCKRDQLLVNGETITVKRKNQESSLDHGWAWVIVIASFTVQLLIDGTISGFGIFFMAMQQDEAFVQANYTRTMLALPGSIQPGFFLCTGAFISPLIQRLGFRVMGSIGSGMVGGGLALASIQHNIHLFNLFYGVFAGSGFGILMVCAIVSVNFYFERFRGIASGIAMAGAGVGCLTIPLVFSRLCACVGWRRGLLIYSVAAFLLALCSAITFRPFTMAVSPSEQPEEEEEDMAEEKARGSLLACDDHSRPIEHEFAKVKVDNNGKSPTNETKQTVPTISSNDVQKPVRGISDGPVIPTEPVPETDEPVADDFGSTVGSRLWKSTQAFKRSQARKPDIRHRSLVNRLRVMGSGDIRLVDTPFQPWPTSKVDPFQRIDIFYSASFAHLSSRDACLLSQDVLERLNTRNLEHADASLSSSRRSAQSPYRSGSALNGVPAGSSLVNSVSTLERNFVTSASSIKPGSIRTGPEIVAEEAQYDVSLRGGTLFHRFRDRLISLFDLSLFTNVRFLFILMIGVANQLAYFIPFVYLVDYAISKGLTEGQAVSLSVILGSLHTVGRIIAGFFANASWMDTVYLSGFGTLAAGLTHLALPSLFPVSFDSFAVYAAMHGLFSAFPVPMIHLLLVRFLGLERLTTSYGNLNLAKSVASVVGPMVAVSLVDQTGETGHYFLVAGTGLILSALAHLGLCRFPWSRPRDNDEAVDERAKCCLCDARRPVLEPNGEETVVYATEPDNNTVEQVA